MSDEPSKTTYSGRAPEQTEGGAPTARTLPDGQLADHWVLSAEERAKGFVRPMRDRYRHEPCGAVTTMPTAIAETYAADPAFYGSTFCTRCGVYKPVGAAGEFTWLDGGKVGA